MFEQVHAGRRRRGQPFVPTWLFVAADLLVWGVAYGLVALAVPDVLPTIHTSGQSGM